jgi:hypothetical protein
MRLFPLLAPLLPVLAGAAMGQTPQQLVSDIPVPPGCVRIALPPGSYSAWLRASPLKADNFILAHNGDTVSSGFYRALAVLGRPLIFRDDLEQCADWCFRLWAEYHRATGKLNRLYLFNYGGRRKNFSKSGKTFRSFLLWAMANANSHSLKRGCAAADTSHLLPGDMLVQNRDGGIGHVSIVMDACADSAGKRYFLMGYGYMPAQEFHIERAEPEFGREGWFSLDGYLAYLERHFDYGQPAFRRFQ